MDYRCVFCGKELDGKKRKFCSNICKCKYFYKQHPEKCNQWIKKHPKSKVNNKCLICSKECGRKKYCSNECKPKIIYPPQEKDYWKEVNRINNKCESCDKTIFVLHVHHINGNHNDNRKENLAVVCSSCHRKIHSKKIKIIKEKQTELRIKIKERIDTFRKRLE